MQSKDTAGPLPDLGLWRRAQLAPVANALYLKDQAAARAALQAAWRELESGRLEAAEREALALNWHYCQVQYGVVFAQDAEAARRAYETGLAALNAPVESPLARAEQASMLLFLRVSMMRRGLRPFPREEFRGLFDRVPPDLRHEYFWHVVSSWAFSSRDLEYLAEAFAAISISPPPEDAEAFWQRTNLMYQLLMDRAQAVDVAHYIARLRLHSMAEEFEKHIWPRVVEAGLGSPELEQAYRDRRAEMDRAGRQLPQPTLATRSVLSRHLRPAG